MTLLTDPIVDDSGFVLAALRADPDGHRLELWLADGLAASDRVDDARIIALGGRARASELGHIEVLARWQLRLAEFSLRVGALQQAASEAGAGLSIVDAHGLVGAEAPALHAVLAEVAWHRNDLEELRRSARSARSSSEAVVRPWLVDQQILLAAGRLARLTGDTETFESLLTTVASDPEAWCHLVVRQPMALMELVALGVEHGASVAVGHLVRLADLLSQRNPTVVSLTGVAEYCRGVVHDDLDQLASAAVHLRALSPLAAAMALEATAVCNRGSFDEPLALYESCGALRGAARVRRLQHSRRQVRTPSRGRYRPLHGWDSLTRTELAVVHHVSAGLTNKEVAGIMFISRFTVDAHLRHAYTKLGIGSRVALTRIALGRS